MSFNNGDNEWFRIRFVHPERPRNPSILPIRKTLVAPDKCSPLTAACNLASATRTAAFSLIELLVVIAIIAILATFTATGFKNIATSHGVGQAAVEVNAIFELARNEAVTRQTYVWAAFREAPNSGILEIQMALAGSIDGSPNPAGTNLTPLSRVVRVRNVGLTNWASLKSGTNTGVFDLASSSAGMTYTNLSTKFTNQATITFTPRGEAMLKGSPTAGDGFNALIGIGIVPARGDVKQTASTGLKEDSGVLLDGSTGMSRILRVQ